MEAESGEVGKSSWEVQLAACFHRTPPTNPRLPENSGSMLTRLCALIELGVLAAWWPGQEVQFNQKEVNQFHEVPTSAIWVTTEESPCWGLWDIAF